MTMSHGIASMKSSRPGDHAIRTLSGILGLGLFFFSISTIPLAEATILAYASPIFITVLSIPILAERIGIRRWVAVAIGFIGAAIIVQPGSVVFGLGSMAAIGSALASAFVVIWLRRMSDTENATTTSIIYNSSGMAVFGVWLLIYGWVNVTSMLDLILLISVGLCASFQQFFFAVAFRYGEASFLAPFEYLVLVLAAVIGIVFWNEIPPVTTMIGGLIIVGSGLFIFSRSKAKSIKESSLN